MNIKKPWINSLSVITMKSSEKFFNYIKEFLI